MTNDSCRVALADQVDAANAEQISAMVKVAEISQSVFLADAPPFARVLLARMAAWYIDGTTNLCRHLSPYAPQPGFWCPWQPGRIRCGRCFGQAGSRVKGTRADHTCDDCGRYAYGALRVFSASVPGKVLDLESQHRPSAWPPTTLVFGLCPECSARQGVPTAR